VGGGSSEVSDGGERARLLKRIDEDQEVEFMARKKRAANKRREIGKEKGGERGCVREESTVMWPCGYLVTAGRRGGKSLAKGRREKRAGDL